MVCSPFMLRLLTRGRSGDLLSLLPLLVDRAQSGAFVLQADREAVAVFRRLGLPPGAAQRWGIAIHQP